MYELFILYIFWRYLGRAVRGWKSLYFLRLNTVYFLRHLPTWSGLATVVRTKKCICYMQKSKSVWETERCCCFLLCTWLFSVNRLSLLLELNDHNLLGTSAALLATGWLKFSGSWLLFFAFTLRSGLHSLWGIFLSLQEAQAQMLMSTQKCMLV